MQSYRINADKATSMIRQINKTAEKMDLHLQCTASHQL